MTISQTQRAERAFSYKTEKRLNSPVDLLRNALDRADRRVVSLDAGTVEDFLLLLNQIEAMFAELALGKAEVRGEEGRWESLQARLVSKPEPLVTAAAAAGGLAKLRTLHAPATGFWWHLDAAVRQRRWQSVRRLVTTTGLVVAIVVGLLWGIDYFFPPDPAVVLATNTTNAVEQLAMEQKWAEALARIQETRKILPDDPELLVWEAVLYEQLGNVEAANASLAQAQALTADKAVALWTLVGSKRLQVGNLDGAEAAIQQALTLAPKDAQAMLWLAGIAEARGDNGRAIELFNQTAELAREADSPELEVMAKMRMGTLLQQANPFAEPESVTSTMTTTITTTVPITP
ncbi:MAG: tetratricopeptide repeat protein [Chloroflexota bacterium]|nr:tetratricopeptide repeat protein [Chloroflexota bacterium]